MVVDAVSTATRPDPLYKLLNGNSQIFSTKVDVLGM